MLSRPSPPSRWVLLLLVTGCLVGADAAGAQTIDNVFPDSGNAGIGTTTPQAPLEIQTSGATAILWDAAGSRLQNSADLLMLNRGEFNLLLDANNDEGTSRFQIFRDTTSSVGQTPLVRLAFGGLSSFFDLPGDFGIGTTSPQGRLHVAGPFGAGTDSLDLLFDPDGAPHGLALKGAVTGNWSREFKFMAGPYNSLFGLGALVNGTDLVRGYIGGNATTNWMWNSTWMVFLPSGNVGIGTDNPATKLEVAGTTRTEVIEITGGADFAEPFELAETVSGVPGMVMSIDPDNPGRIRVADTPYDRTVVGVLSGGNGVQPGMIMRQQGTEASGSSLLALTGRVYVLADASNGPIRPGDLLTTSSHPGYAMRVIDHDRALGAVLGKAMSSLPSGQGMVLAVIALQ